jgi:hypothetical protein
MQFSLLKEELDTKWRQEVRRIGPVCCLLSAVCCLLSAVCCLLSAVCCLLPATIRL